VSLHPEDALLNSSFIVLMDISVNPPQFFPKETLMNDLNAIIQTLPTPIKIELKNQLKKISNTKEDLFYLEAAKLYIRYIEFCTQNDRFPNLSIEQIPGKGKGLITKEDLPRGIFLGTYTGEIISKKEILTQELYDYLKQSHDLLEHKDSNVKAGLVDLCNTIMQKRMYRLDIGQDNSAYEIDAINTGSHIRFVNDADSESDVNIQHELYVNKKGLPHRAYVTSTSVAKGEELLVNYGPEHLKHCNPESLKSILSDSLKSIDTSQAPLVQEVTSILQCCAILFPSIKKPFPKKEILNHLQNIQKANPDLASLFRI
jgi:hypothetical protein